MKKILHIIESLNIGGAENLLCNTIKELPEYEHLILTVFAANNLLLLPPNTKHISLNAKSKTAIFFKLREYKNVLRNYKPDIVHAHLYFATILAKAATPSSIPLLFTQHFEFSKNATKWYYWFTDRLLSTTKQTCIAVSNVVLNDYIKTTGFKGRKYVLGIYIPDHYFKMGKPAKRLYNGHIKVIALGNIKPIKNQRYLLEAFALVKDLPVTCDIYGEGEERLSLEAEAREKNVPVFFKGLIPDSSAVLCEYDLYIMPSLTEGFPLALFESMASSLPAIVSDIPVFHELLGEHGDYVSLQQPADVGSILKKYLEHPDRLLTKGAQMKSIAREKASRSSYLQKLRRIYNQHVAGEYWKN